MTYHAFLAGSCFPSRVRCSSATRLTGFLVSIALLLSPCLVHADDSAAQRREVPYTVEFTGKHPDAMAALVKRVSSLQTGTSSPPVSDVGLRRRVRADVERIGAALRAEGYYAARVTEYIDLTVVPATVQIDVVTGELYVISGVRFRLGDERPTPHAVALLETVSRPATDAPARSAVVTALAEDALRAFVDAGYLAARLGEREFRVDHATRTLRGEVELRVGARARFGALRFEGLIDVREDYVASLVDWHEGDYLVRARIDATTKALLSTRLFDSVRVNREAPPEGQTASPVSIVLVERPFRSIGFGLAYDSTDGPSANTFWEHRNLGGAGRSLRLGVQAGLDELGGSIAYRQPNFFLPTQAFLADAALLTDDTEAYEVDRVTAAVGLERLLAPGTVGRVGLAFDTGWVEAEAIEDGTPGRAHVTFLSLPLVLRYDGSDDLLAPTRGVRVDFESIPFWELFGADSSFSKNELALRGYRTLDRGGRWVGALRGSVGTILGAARSDIPVDKRFFSGGGGSVRGYEHQFAGPLGPDRTDPTQLRPIGGRSMFEAGGELRLRVGESFGLVAFAEGGSVYESPTPDLDDKFYVGAGLGGRYYTAIGPIRIDVATPINGRDSDDPVQVYISIGESY